jgi:ribosomal protein L17
MFRAERDFRRDLNRIITLPFEGELHNVRETVYRTNDQEAIEAMHRLMDKVYDR